VAEKTGATLDTGDRDHDAALHEVLVLVKQANAIRPTLYFALLDDLARQYHAQRDRTMLEYAIASGRRMLANLRANEVQR
jgi:hypothetical protein